MGSVLTAGQSYIAGRWVTGEREMIVENPADETIAGSVGVTPLAEVGTAIGAAVGGSVGEAVGSKVGFRVGVAVGPTVGCAVGAAVGSRVGTAVGA